MYSDQAITWVFSKVTVNISGILYHLIRANPCLPMLLVCCWTVEARKQIAQYGRGWCYCSYCKLPSLCCHFQLTNGKLVYMSVFCIATLHTLYYIHIFLQLRGNQWLSKGKFSSLPSMSRLGEQPVLSWRVFLYAMVTYGNNWCQSSLDSDTSVLSICWSVWLNLSTNPSVCGRYGVVRALEISSNFHNSVKRWLSKFLPWWLDLSVYLNLLMNSLNNTSATVYAVWPLNA